MTLQENFQLFLTAALNCSSYQNESDRIKSISSKKLPFNCFNVIQMVLQCHMKEKITIMHLKIVFVTLVE